MKFFFFILSIFEGVTSIPPPNQSCVVQIYLVLKCIAGIKGFFICILQKFQMPKILDLFEHQVYFFEIVLEISINFRKVYTNFIKNFSIFKYSIFTTTFIFFVFLFQVVDLNVNLFFSSF